MQTLLRRLPSKREARSLFIICTFVVNAWSIYNLLRWLPSLLPRLRLSEVLVILSYTQAFALLESLIVFVFLVFLGALLPKHAMRDQWVPKGSIFIFLTAIWTAIYHYFPELIPIWDKIGGAITRLFQTGAQAAFVGFIVFLLVYVGVYILLLVSAFTHIQRRKAFADSIHHFVDRLLVLAIFYVLLDVSGGIIVFFHLVLL